MDIAFHIIWSLFIGCILFISCNLSFQRFGTVNDKELNVTLAICTNKLVGMIGIVGSMIAAILLFK